jgi:2-amino-4-hydroxy-6-hydroxymethyldihydropteridine diphosphokinase
MAHEKRPALALLGLGSNIGDRAANLRAALAGIAAFPDCRLLKAAGIFQTRPVGGAPGQDDFYNTGCQVETRLPPRELLANAQRLERELGRRRESEAAPWGPRTLDIDILLWEDLILDEPDLTLPHPRLEERAFALAPLAELAPDAVHPASRLTVLELLERLGNNNEIVCRLPL